MSVAARTAERVLARRAALARVQPRTASILAGLVAGSFLLRTVLAWLRATPTFFADEYIYAELARSISETGRPLVRGASASFPALLQPILTAPAWLVGDVETSFRLVQTIGALVMSLAVVPVFLLARRLGIGSSLALVLAALAVLVPDMVFAGWVVAEPFAYPLVLAAVAVGTVALARPRPRLQLAFLALAGLAAFARIQFAVLPVCFLAAAMLIGLREGRLRGAFREQRLVFALLLVPALGLFAVGPGRALGFYEGVLDIDFISFEFTKWVGLDAMFLAYASGVVLAPGALLGLWLALRHPRSREELAFGALAVTLIGVLLLEAAAYGLEGRAPGTLLLLRGAARRDRLRALRISRLASSPRTRRPRRGARGHCRTRPTLRLFAADFKTGSPVLFATSRLEEALGDVSLASLAVAVAVTVLAASVVLLARRPAVGTPATLGLALAVCAATYGGAVSFNLGSADRARESTLGPQPSFVDASGVEDVAMLQTRSSTARPRLRVPLLEPLGRRRLPPALRRASGCVRGHEADNRRRRDAARGRQAGHPPAPGGHLQRHGPLPRLGGGRHVARLQRSFARRARSSSRSTRRAATRMGGSASSARSTSGRRPSPKALAGMLSFELTAPGGSAREGHVPPAGRPARGDHRRTRQHTPSLFRRLRGRPLGGRLRGALDGLGRRPLRQRDGVRADVPAGPSA